MDELTTHFYEFTQQRTSVSGNSLHGLQWRGGPWQLHAGTGNEEEYDYLSRLRGAQLWLDATAHRSYYDPLRETPNAFLEHQGLGEKVWKIGMKWDEDLATESSRLHEEFGPLTSSLDDEPVSLHSYWKDLRKLALAVQGIQSRHPEGVNLRPSVVERITHLYTEMREQYSVSDTKMVDETHQLNIRSLDRTILEWSIIGKSSNLAKEDAYSERLGSWLSFTINEGFRKFGVWSQVNFKAPRSWFRSYSAMTLGGALWVQVAGVVLSHSLIKPCKNVRCIRDKLFVAGNPRAEYCSPQCKLAQKKRRRRSK